MSFPKDITVGLYGASCTGKSTLARALSTATGYRILHCGEAVKTRVIELGLALASDLPIEEHRRLDDRTRELAADRPIVVEGTFLDMVLATVPKLFLIRLECDERTRTARLCHRLGVNDAWIGVRDQQDLALLELLYANRQGRFPNMEINTGLEDSSSSLAKILGALRDISK